MTINNGTNPRRTSTNDHHHAEMPHNPRDKQIKPNMIVATKTTPVFQLHYLERTSAFPPEDLIPYVICDDVAFIFFSLLFLSCRITNNA
jgi:hypothetical protein